MRLFNFIGCLAGGNLGEEPVISGLLLFVSLSLFTPENWYLHPCFQMTIGKGLCPVFTVF